MSSQETFLDHFYWFLPTWCASRLLNLFLCLFSPFLFFSLKNLLDSLRKVFVENYHAGSARVADSCSATEAVGRSIIQLHLK